MTFRVTEAAMRPASPARKCFYCNARVGDMHGANCVLIQRRAKVRMIIEYEIEAPADWDGAMIEFHRNDSSWCAGNALPELEKAAGNAGCLCAIARFEFIEHVGEPYIAELP